LYFDLPVHGQTSNEFNYWLKNWVFHVSLIFKNRIKAIGVLKAIPLVSFECKCFCTNFDIVRKKEKHRLRYRERDDLTCRIEGKIETVTVEVHLENRKILFCLVYRPPGAVSEEFFEGFESFTSRIRASNLDCICAGDFNFYRLNLSGVNLDFLI